MISTQESIVSINPATGEELGRVPIYSAPDVSDAVHRVRVAQPAWNNLSFRERGKVIMRARRIILDEIDEIAQLISRETGKPIPEAISMEITPALDLMQYFARQAAKFLKSQKINLGMFKLLGRTSRIVYKPYGVIGIISPWNFPWSVPIGGVVMALMAGNGVVLKPSELTPLTGLKIGDVLLRGGLPHDLVQVVTGDGSTGAALIEAGTDKICFTGSVETGKRIAQTAARTLTPVLLELGGKDPMIVLEDSNLEAAARGAVWGAFANSGQACASVERCYVHESIAEFFINRVVELTGGLKQGNGCEDSVDIGAMSSERQLKIVEEHVQDAVSNGARILIGGTRLLESAQPGGLFFAPTVLSGVNHTMKIMREETFGPVLPVMTFRHESEAIEWANKSTFGLTASVWTCDLKRGRRIAEKLEAGTVTVNEVLYTHAIPQTPWGGVKQSGQGRTHGRLGLLELVLPQHVH
ncbi:MAG: aldehyde dehydrogenase family protein, partial [Pyrinomonadaceae bacterium]